MIKTWCLILQVVQLIDLMAKIVNCWHVAPCKGIQHGLGFYIPSLGFPNLPRTEFKTLSGELGFWIPVLVGFQIRWALFRIPQAKCQFQDSKILIFLHGTRHETETLIKGQQLGGKKTEATYTLRIAFRISTKSYPIGLSGIVMEQQQPMFTHIVSSIQLEDHSRQSKKTLGDRAFSNASAKIWNSLPQSLKSQQNLISTPLRHCFKLTILEKRLIYNFFLVFHIVYIFAFYCKFKIVNR